MSQHHFQAETHVDDAMSAAGLVPADHKADVTHAMRGTQLSKIFALLDSNDPNASAEGDKELKALFATVLGVCNHVKGLNLPGDTAFLDKSITGLTTILSPDAPSTPGTDAGTGTGTDF